MANEEIPLSPPAEDADSARRKAAEYQRAEKPTETETHGMAHEPESVSLNRQIRDRIVHPHKGDVGRPGTNEEIYQGSKQRELEPQQDLPKEEKHL